MQFVQQYFNPWHQLSLMRAEYGFCALTHCTGAALKVQNTALKTVAVFLAILVDATAGLGILCTPSYNFGVFLYNCLGRMRHSFQHWKEGKKWNPTALKVWASIGGATAFLAAVYYFGVWGAVKDRIQNKEALSSDNVAAAMQSPQSSASTHETTSSSFFSRAGKCFLKDLLYSLPVLVIFYGIAYYFHPNSPRNRISEKARDGDTQSPLRTRPSRLRID